MNKIDNTKQVRSQTGTTTIKLLKTSISKPQNNYYKLSLTVNETAGLFPVKIKKKNVLYFYKLLYGI
jgi:hypothetical protein